MDSIYCNITRKPISVSKNGKLVSKLVHQQTKNAEEGGKPHVEDLTEVDIPELDIHEQIMNNDGFVRKIQEKRSVSKLFGLSTSYHIMRLFADQLACPT